MSPSPEALVRPELAAVLRDLGPAVRRGSQAGAEARPELAGLATGIEALDRLLGGGLPSGRLSELCGPPSSGRTALALTLLARATERGALVGVVDPADAFHPLSAATAGVRLERVLWARPPGALEAVRCSERLLRAGGFAAVWLDAADDGPASAGWQNLGAAVWQRLVRAAEATDTALLVLSHHRVTGTHAHLALELQPRTARFTGVPLLFEGVEGVASVTRQRRGACPAPVPLYLGARTDPTPGTSGT